MKELLIGLTFLAITPAAIATTYTGDKFTVISSDPLDVSQNTIIKNYDYSDSFSNKLFFDDFGNYIGSTADYAVGDNFPHTGINQGFNLKIVPDSGYYISKVFLGISIDIDRTLTSPINMFALGAGFSGPGNIEIGQDPLVSDGPVGTRAYTFVAYSARSRYGIPLSDPDYFAYQPDNFDYDNNAFPEDARFVVNVGVFGQNLRAYYTLNYVSIHVFTSPVPEPGSYAVLGLGLAVLSFVAKLRRKLLS